MKRGLLLLALALGLAFAAASSAVYVARQALAPVAEAGAPARAFTVERGQTLGAIAARLEAEGLVRSATALKALARWRDEQKALQVGEFALSPSQSTEEILDTIVSGRVITYEVAIPEGFTMVQIAERVAASELASAEDFLAAARSAEFAQELGVEGETLEGYLFPETYHMPRGLTPKHIARIFVAHFFDVWRDLEPKANAAGLSMREVVTLGSIIEKETGAPEERPLIASVFLNRIARGMRLETDPTVIYGIPNFDGNIRRKHLEDRANPYNTYVIPGLPPGPIASPGRAALTAVLEPAESNYLFFVSRNDGTHVFSETYRQHVKAVDRYQRR